MTDMIGGILARRAQTMFMPARKVKEGPPSPYRRWNERGAMLAWLRSLGIDADEFVNWIRARVVPGPIARHEAPYANEPGYYLYYYGESPTEQAIRRALH